MEESVRRYLQQKDIEVQDKDIATTIIQLLQQKQALIQNLSHQITKYKCDEIKNNKLIKHLQDKINLIAPSTSNTASSFMMPSQFKSHFQQFMSSHLSSAFGSILDRPFLFSKCVSDIFSEQYCLIQNRVKTILNSIIYIMNLQQQKSYNPQIEHQLRTSLISVFQEHWQHIFPFISSSLHYSIDNQEHQDILNEVNELLVSQDFLDMQKNLHKMSVYMVLQEKKWQFQKLGENKVVKYNKKEFTCIDGFIKEGQNALMILQGIIKQDHRHPNLKNYVIPYDEDEQLQIYAYKDFTLKRVDAHDNPNNMVILNTQENQEHSAMQPKEIHESLHIQPIKQKENSYIAMPQSCLITKNKSTDQLIGRNGGKEVCLKKSKKKQKGKISFEDSLNLTQRSPRANIKKYEEAIKHKKMTKEQGSDLNDKLLIINEAMNKKKNHTKILNNCNANEQISFPLKERNILEEIPISKELLFKKRSKPNTSRKNSVGKIVSQNYVMYGNGEKDKENNLNTMNAKPKNKEKIYKQIIKEKLLEDKLYDKLTNSMNFPVQKSKTDRQAKKKEENRPLKLQSNVNKLREKYIFKD